jgi:flagellin
VSFSINTNVASLQAQGYLRTNSDFQSKTINRVTSGLRIVSSGDDAAGLAIANGYRSDESVLTQGVQNANNGLSQLQIMDGGISNISQLLDRARTLATQSASGTFTGDRGVLNSEFQSVLGEIDRQAQSIGLNQGGTFAKNLSVFIGGGKGSTASAVINNGSVSVNLASSTVDTKSLGLAGVQASGVAGTDIGTGSTNSSVANILATGANTTSEAVSGSTVFYFQGPGYSGANKVAVSVNLSGVTDATTLAAALNTAIQNTTGSQFTTAFKNQNITAAINTDINGKQQLTFSSSVGSFQVEAGDRVANAFLGNFVSGSVPTGVALANTITGHASTSADATTFANTGTVVIRIQGDSLAAPVDLQLAVTSGVTSVGAFVTSLTTAVANNGQLQAAGITLNSHSSATALVFNNSHGEGFTVSATGDKADLLGLGSFESGATATNFDNTQFSGAASGGYVAGTSTFEISIGGGAAIAGSVTTSTTGQTEALLELNNLFTTTAAFQAAGLKAVAGDATHINIVSTNGTNFRLNGLTDVAVLGTGTGGVSISGATGSTASALTAKSTFAAGGSAQTAVGYTTAGGTPSDVFYFGAFRNGTDVQNITLTAPDASGTDHTLSVKLNNTNARSLDEALATINTALQQSNDTTLNKIVAVKEQGTINNTNTEGLRFTSTLNAFKVTVGTVAGSSTSTPVGIAESTAVNTGAPNYVQGSVYSSAISAGGGTAGITSQATAQAAVSALATAVSTLGSAQASVGKGENQFGYAINLAQSQLTNLATAESRIRDADLAAEAANLTKAQILLQAGVAALAQANSAPQSVLALLK